MKEARKTFKGGGKPYQSMLREHRRTMRKWRTDGATFPEIAALLAKRGCVVSADAVRMFLSREAKRRPALAPQVAAPPSQPQVTNGEVPITPMSELKLTVCRPKPQPPSPPPRPKPPLPEHLKPENWAWHPDYKSKPAPDTTPGI